MAEMVYTLQMEFGSTQASNSEKGTVVQRMDVLALTEEQRVQLLRALQEASKQSLPGSSDQLLQCQQGVGLTQQDGGSEDRKHQRGGLRLAITASTPGESKQGTLVDPEKIDKGVESSNRTQMKIDLEAEQDSKMELGSEGEKEAGQWSSGKKPGLDGNKTDRSHSSKRLSEPGGLGNMT